MEPLMTSDEVAAILRVDVVTIRRLVNRGELTAYKVGSEYRFSRNDLMDFLQKQRVSGEAEESGLEGEGIAGWRKAAYRARFDKFTERARRVLSYAQEEAQRFQHNYIGTEHLLLGLVREEGGVAAKVLASIGIELDKVRKAVEFIIGRGDHIVLGEVGLTPRAKKVIELAVDEANRLHHHYIGTEHVLLGLLREGEGIAAGVLRSQGLLLDRVREEVLRVLIVMKGEAESKTADQAEQTAEGEQEVKCSYCGTSNPKNFRYCFNCGTSLEERGEEGKAEPWATAGERYTSGQIVTGIVTSVAPFGAFVRLEDGIEGLLQASELPPDMHPQTGLHEGAELKLRILRIDAERRRLALSLREVDEPDTTKE